MTANPLVVECVSVDTAAAVLTDPLCIASLVPRPLTDANARDFIAYVATRPRWPDSEYYHPMEATHDRSAVIDFEPPCSNPSSSASLPPMIAREGDALAGASGYGRELPPRFSPLRATARTAIAHVLSVLPVHLAAAASTDAESLLLALRTHTGKREFVLRLELVLGDTCQRWHCDQNVSRSLITYVGPGTECAHEWGVQRTSDGSVQDAQSDSVVKVNTGDVLIMKGGLWAGLEGWGTAHRAPKIGPVLECQSHRLVLKVDILEDD